MLPDKNTCMVYHGTNLFSANIIQTIGIRLEVQRQLTDFGKGFYVTFNREQAKNWTHIRASHPQISPELLKQLGLDKTQFFKHPDTRIPAYLAYELNVKQLRQLKGKIFPLPHEADWPEYQKSWKYFVQHCRKGKPHPYDYVYGPVGGGHLTNANEIKASKAKNQLSLNSAKATSCLFKMQVVVLKPKKSSPKKSMVQQ